MGKEHFNLGIKWPANQGPLTFANNATMQLDESGNVYLTFYQVCPPIVVAKTPEELQAMLEQSGPIEALSVSRIALSLKDAKKVLKLLKDHLEGGENE